MNWRLFSCRVVLPAVGWLLLIGTAESAAGSAVPDAEVRQAVIEIQQKLFDDQFDAADSLARRLQVSHPDQPLGFLFGGISLVVRTTAREEEYRSDRFHQLLDSTEALTERFLETADSTEAAWLCLSAGHARSYRSLWEARFGSKTSALKIGLAARDWYELGLEQDSSLGDLYFGLGMYHYWKSVRAGMFRWVGIFSDDREQGIEELYRAVESSAISEEAARNSLIWVWLEEGAYDSTIALAQSFLHRYPNGSSVLWPLGAAYVEQNNYHLALETYQDLRRRLETDPGNYYNLIECDYRIWQCYDRLDMGDRAKDVAKRVRDYVDDVPDQTQRRHRDTIARLKRAARL